MGAMVASASGQATESSVKRALFDSAFTAAEVFTATGPFRITVV